MRWQTRKRLAVLMASVAATATIAAAAGTVMAQAKTGVRGRGALSQARAAPSCNTPRTICAFSGPNGSGRKFQFAISDNHSRWTNFKKVSNPNGSMPFRPHSIINNSKSDIWVYDAAAAAKHSTVGGPYCAFGSDSTHIYNFSDWVPINGGTKSQDYTTRTYQPGWFYIQYNVNTCATKPSSPLP